MARSSPRRPAPAAGVRRRLTGRGTDSAEVIAARMDRAQAEISHWDGYDYVVINDELDRAVAELLESIKRNPPPDPTIHRTSCGGRGVTI